MTIVQLFAKVNSLVRSWCDKLSLKYSPGEKRHFHCKFLFAAPTGMCVDDFFDLTCDQFNSKNNNWLTLQD